MKNQKKEITNHEEFDLVRYVSEIDKISSKNAHEIRNVYLTYVGNSHICLTCPSSLSFALKKIKDKFPESYLDELEIKLDNQFKAMMKDKVQKYMNENEGGEEGKEGQTS